MSSSSTSSSPTVENLPHEQEIISLKPPSKLVTKPIEAKNGTKTKINKNNEQIRNNSMILPLSVSKSVKHSDNIVVTPPISQISQQSTITTTVEQKYDSMIVPISVTNVENDETEFTQTIDYTITFAVTEDENEVQHTLKT